MLHGKAIEILELVGSAKPRRLGWKGGRTRRVRAGVVSGLIGVAVGRPLVTAGWSVPGHLRIRWCTMGALLIDKVEWCARANPAFRRMSGVVWMK
jgi:hypothetical protein